MRTREDTEFAGKDRAAPVAQLGPASQRGGAGGRGAGGASAGGPHLRRDSEEARPAGGGARWLIKGGEGPTEGEAGADPVPARVLEPSSAGARASGIPRPQRLAHGPRGCGGSFRGELRGQSDDPSGASPQDAAPAAATARVWGPAGLYPPGSCSAVPTGSDTPTAG